MVKKNSIQKVYWLETSKSKLMPWEKCMIAESRSILRTILTLKHEEMIKKRESKSIILKENEKINKQKKIPSENNSQLQFFKSNESKQIEFLSNQKNFLKRKQMTMKKMEDQKQLDSQSQLQEYPQIFKKFLEKIVEKARINKNKLKAEKGLPLEQQFIPQSFHVCQYCGRKFLKPCSLGGHISKIHWEERKREKESIEMPQWEYETPIRQK